jgi:LmbE family N-acetylglucosaminyl deacetylase
MRSRVYVFAAFLAAGGAVYLGAVEWQPYPQKAALLLVHAHPDDESIHFGGSLTFYAAVRNLPVVDICMTTPADGRRARELENACAVYGLKYKPIMAGFGDCCIDQLNSVQCCWDCWGGKDKAVGYLAGMIRRLRPDVVLAHAFNGEYGHPNHIGSAYATVEACEAAADQSKFAGQLDSVDVWTVKKVYVHLHDQNNWVHGWDMTSPLIGGKKVIEVALEGLKQHLSQADHWTINERCGEWGLYATTVGPDIEKNDDFFENVDLSAYPSAFPYPYDGDPHEVFAALPVPGLLSGRSEGLLTAGPPWYTLSGRRTALRENVSQRNGRASEVVVFRGGRGNSYRTTPLLMEKPNVFEHERPSTQ